MGEGDPRLVLFIQNQYEFVIYREYRYPFGMKPALEAPDSTLKTTGLTAFERRDRSFAWNWHYHSEMELTLIQEGHGTRLVGDHSHAYGPGELVLIGPALPHTWFSEHSSVCNRAVVVQFRRELFPEALQQLSQFAPIAQLLHDAHRGIHFSRETSEVTGSRLCRLIDLEGIHRWLALAELLHDLASEPKREILASSRYQHRRSHQLNSRLERVTEYLEQHCGEDISLSQAARIAGLTPNAFSRFFHKMTHRTFTSYRNACRIREACRLLDETDLSITEIAFACGFGNLSNFHRRFREEKQITPREYRRPYRPPE